MQTMTSPTTWPTMLSILEWLVNFVEVKYHNLVHVSNFFTQLEVTIHDDRRVGDQEKWKLYVSCYKKVLEIKASSTQSAKLESSLFNSEFDAYRNSKLGIDGDESFTDLRNKRVEFDAELERIRALVVQVSLFIHCQIELIIFKEEEKISELKKNISGTAEDIKTMEKYTEDLMATFTRNSELKEEYDLKLASVVKKNEDLEAKRLSKEQQIANQKMSGDEARQLLSNRQMVILV